MVKLGTHEQKIVQNELTFKTIFIVYFFIIKKKNHWIITKYTFKAKIVY